jgi:hypothetical protein
MVYKQNDFARELLNYEKEGRYAISLPDGWSSESPLFARTALAEEMDDLAVRLYSATCAEWYFLIGAPGNGKSEAMGVLARKLRDLSSVQGLPDLVVANRIIGSGSIPREYTINLPHGRTLLVIQDATAPSTLTSDPAQDLLGELANSARSPATSLVVCANRGVLQKCLMSASGFEAGILKGILEASREDLSSPPAPQSFSAGSGHHSFELRVWPLDHESILHGAGSGPSNPWRNPEGSTLDLLVQNAVSDARWDSQGCADCEGKPDCPFYLDSRWLVTPTFRLAFLSILRRAEALSGHRLVLREALTVLANVLVGSRHDFSNEHPCEWMERQHRTLIATSSSTSQKSGALLALVSHRIYMDIFSRHAPAGLSSSPTGPDALYLDVLDSHPPLDSLSEAVRKLDRQTSREAGVSRLVDEKEGILREFDPVNGGIRNPSGGLDPDARSSDQRAVILSLLGGQIPSLEERLLDLAQRFERNADDLPSHEDAAKVHAALNRWLTAYTSRLSGLALGKHRLADELDAYLALLGNPTLPFTLDGQTNTLGELLHQFCNKSGEARFPCGRNLNIVLGTVYAQPGTCRPRNTIPRWPASDRLNVRFTDGKADPVPVAIPARIFLALVETQIAGLARWCLPPEIDQAFSQWIRTVGAKGGVTRHPFVRAEYNDGTTKLILLRTSGSLNARWN